MGACVITLFSHEKIFLLMPFNQSLDMGGNGLEQTTMASIDKEKTFYFFFLCCLEL